MSNPEPNSGYGSQSQENPNPNLGLRFQVFPYPDAILADAETQRILLESFSQPQAASSGPVEPKKQEMILKQKSAALFYAGKGFITHFIIINPGEDIAEAIKVFVLSQQGGPREFSIFSALGIVSKVIIRHPKKSDDLITYEGMFGILSLEGSFLHTCEDISQNLNILFSENPDKVYFGNVAGSLTAASPVQVVFGSYATGAAEESTSEGSDDDFVSD